MDRAKFIKTLGCAIVGVPLAMSLLNSCESLYYAQTKQVDGKFIVKKSEFIQTKAKGTSFRNFVLINKGVGGYPICLYRNGEDDYTASLLQCTHQGCELDVGGGIYTCPCHGSEFSTNGEVLQGPAEKQLKTFLITTDHENIYIHLV